MRRGSFSLGNIVIANAKLAGVFGYGAKIIIIDRCRKRIASIVEIVDPKLGVTLQNHMVGGATAQHGGMMIFSGQPAFAGPPQKQADVTTCALPSLGIFKVVVTAIDRHSAWVAYITGVRNAADDRSCSQRPQQLTLLNSLACHVVAERKKFFQLTLGKPATEDSPDRAKR